jgi:hypothetical protein
MKEDSSIPSGGKTFKNYKDSIPVQSQKRDAIPSEEPENGDALSFSLDRRSIMNIVKRKTKKGDQLPTTSGLRGAKAGAAARRLQIVTKRSNK